MCWRWELSRASFPLRSTAGPLFPVVFGLPRLFRVGCSRIAARCGLGRRGELACTCGDVCLNAVKAVYHEGTKTRSKCRGELTTEGTEDTEGSHGEMRVKSSAADDADGRR